MLWLVACLIVILITVVAFMAWRKRVVSWRQIEEIIAEIERGEEPRTFLIGDGRQAQLVGFQLENIFKELERLKKQVAKRESGMQTILSAMQDALLLVDSNRQVILSNETFRKLFGIAEVSAAVPLLEVVRDPTLESLVADALTGTGPVRGELGLDQSQLELHAVATRNEAGDVTGALVLFHDITELKKMDQIRRDFVANVSHELRTPLSILRGYIETLLDNSDTSGEDFSRILTVMERHSKRLDSLVEDLLMLAELESANPNLQLRDIDLSNLFGEVVRDWEKKLAIKHLNLIVDLPSDFPAVRADRARLQEALYNLLDNAVKYSRDRGQIRLNARRRDGLIELSVRDSGIGIAKQDLPRIFERFYRADKARGSTEFRGTGLGLAIVKHIVQLHGGRVEAESELGKETTIRLILPSAKSVDS